MPSTNFQAIDPADLAPIPDVPDQYGPRNEEEARVLAMARKRLAGPFLTLEEVMSKADAVIAAKH